VRLSGEDGWMGYPGRKKRGCSSGHRTGCLPVLEQVKRRRILKDRAKPRGGAWFCPRVAARRVHRPTGSNGALAWMGVPDRRPWGSSLEAGLFAGRRSAKGRCAGWSHAAGSGMALHALPGFAWLSRMKRA